MKTPFRNAVAMALIAFGLAACAQPETPDNSYYRVAVAGPAHPSATPILSGTVQVDRFSVDGILGQSQIAHITADKSHELQTYHYHFWVEPPDIMLRDTLVDYLSAAHVGNRVVTPEMRVNVDYVLTTRIKRLELIAGATPQAAVELVFSLRHANDGKLIYLADEKAVTNAASASVGDGVRAVDAALDEIFARLLNGLKSVK